MRGKRARLTRRPTLGDLGATAYPSFGVGKTPTNQQIDVIGWQRNTGLSLSPSYDPVWVARGGSTGSGGKGMAPAYSAPVTVPTNISTPVTTQTTTSVSPVFNIAAGSQGITQGGSTRQDTTPTSVNQTPQGTSQSGFTAEQMQQMLEQKMREQAALSAQQQTLAIREAELRAQQAAWEASQKQAAEFDARLKAMQAATQAQTPMPVQQQQSAPVPMVPPPLAPKPAAVTVENSKYPGLPEGTIVPGKAGTDAVNTPAPLQSAASGGKTLPILAAVVIGALLLSGKNRNQPRKKAHGKRKSR